MTASRQLPIARAATRVLLAVAALVAVAALATCSIDRRSDALACERTSECSDGRSCVDHYCVVAPPKVCPSRCTRCADGTCFIECVTQACDAVACPEGWRCDFVCTSDNCTDLDCRNSECSITCVGADACNKVRCGDQPCTIVCTGRRACDNVDCADSCACRVDCTSADSCTNDVSCPPGCDAGGGCDGQSTACNTCP